MHAGEKNTGMINEAIEIVRTEPHYRPIIAAYDDITVQHEEFLNQSEIKKIATEILKTVEGNMAVMGDTLCEYAFALNNLLRDNAKRGDRKAMALYERLSSFRPQKGPKHSATAIPVSATV
jgi:recombinational DNA repair ATPase RecF